MIECPECGKVMEHVETDTGQGGFSVEYFCCPNNCCRATRETQFHYDSLTQGKEVKP